MPAPPPAALVLAVLIAAPAAFAAPRSVPHAGPTLAVEDTMYAEVPEVLVRAPRVTLDEILDRVARGEAHRDSLIHDQVFTVTARVVRNSADRKKPPELFSESVAKVWKKKPNLEKTVVLRRWQLKPPKNEDDEPNVRVEYSSDTSEEIVNFAFRPEGRRRYRFKIAGRDLVGGHVIYRITFEPRSALEASEPSGMVWVDTNEFVIVRQEVNFERSPVPLILRAVDRMVIERERVEGVWVLSRVLLRARFTVSLPQVGSSMDLSLRFDDYAINRGIEDSVFAGIKKP